MRHALATAQVQLDITRLVLSYGHLAFIAAIIIVAVGLHDSVAAPTHALSWAVAGLLFGGTALYLAFVRLHAVGDVPIGLVDSAVDRGSRCPCAVPFAPHVPALAALFALAIVLAVLNAVELAMSNRSAGARGSAGDEPAAGDQRQVERGHAGPAARPRPPRPR